MKAQIAAANALLFVTPEHNRSLPTARKNVLDWVSRPYGKNLWAGKPAGIVGASVGTIGTAVESTSRSGGCVPWPTLPFSATRRGGCC